MCLFHSTGTEIGSNVTSSLFFLARNICVLLPTKKADAISNNGLDMSPIKYQEVVLKLLSRIIQGVRMKTLPTVLLSASHAQYRVK